MNLYIAKSSVEKTILFIPVTVKHIEKNLFIMKPYYSEQILPVSCGHVETQTMQTADRVDCAD